MRRTPKNLDTVVDQTTQVIRNSVGILKTGVKQWLDGIRVNFETVPGLGALFEDNLAYVTHSMEWETLENSRNISRNISILW